MAGTTRAIIQNLNTGTSGYTGGRDDAIRAYLTSPQMSMRQFLKATLVDALGFDIDLVFPGGDPNAEPVVGGATFFDEMVRAFGDREFEMIITDDNLNRLIEADLDIRALEAAGEPLHDYATNASTSGAWNAFKKSLGKLQGLAILKRIRAGDCTGTINTIVTALTNKINTVNDILQENLQSGGGNTQDPYVHKYWKYKFKYELAKY